jgi:Uma2 family endonuclease
MNISSPILEPDHQLLPISVSSGVLQVTPTEFDRLCRDNPDLRLELAKDGKLIIMPPTGGDTGKRNIRLAAQVAIWNDRTELGEAFDSSTGYDFTALGGGKLSPDVSWIAKEQLVGISIAGFIPVVPNFVIELLSNSDRLGDLQAKMLEYQRLGVAMGLLVNPRSCQVEIYRLGQPMELLVAPMAIDCNPVMAGLVLDLTKIWP